MLLPWLRLGGNLWRAERRTIACRDRVLRPHREQLTRLVVHEHPDRVAQTRQRRRVSADASARAPNGGDHTLSTATGNADHGDPAQNDRHRGDGLRRKPLTRE